MPSGSSRFTAIHFNMVYYPRTFKLNMKVPSNGKEGFGKKRHKTKAHIQKTWEKKNPDTIKL